MMTKNISLGQYVPVDSPLHRLDPRTKLAWTLAYVLSLFIMRGIWAVGLAVIFLVVIIRLSAIPPLLYLKAAKPLWPWLTDSGCSASLPCPIRCALTRRKR